MNNELDKFLASACEYKSWQKQELTDNTTLIISRSTAHRSFPLKLVKALDFCRVCELAGVIGLVAPLNPDDEKVDIFVKSPDTKLYRDVFEIEDDNEFLRKISEIPAEELLLIEDSKMYRVKFEVKVK
jgi:hypothetical protein